MRFLLAIAFVSTGVLAQTPQIFEIRGTVVETGIGPIAGARVYVRPVIPTDVGPIAEIFTTARGEFSIRVPGPGRYVVGAERQGYVNESQSALASVDADHPRADFNLKMLRPAIATGRVVDAETREPVEGVLVRVVGKSQSPNPVSWIMVGLAATSQEEAREMATRVLSDRNGIFSQTVRPLDAAAVTISAVPSQTPLSTAYDSEAFKIVDQEIENSYWPGGVPADLVVPLRLAPGATVNFGDILLKKVPRYRVHLSIPQGDCPQGESVRVFAYKPGLPSNGPARVFACGSEVLLRGFEPGVHTLYAVSDWQGERDNIEGAVWGNTEFVIKDQNVEASLEPHHGIVVEGQLSAAEGLKTLPGSIAIGVQPEPLVRGVTLQPEQFIEWLQNGRFRMAISPRPQTLVTPPGQSGNVYIKQVFYNGLAQSGTSVPLNAGTDVHHLEIVLDDKLASLTVNVMDGDHPAQNPYVFLWKEGTPVSTLTPVPIIAVNRLVPGDYRILAVPSGTMFPSEDVMNRGEKITLRAGTSETLNIKLSSVK